MENCNTVVGMDVHKETIVAAVFPRGKVKPVEVARVENCPASVEKLVRRLVSREGCVFVYEAGPCGYDVYRQITSMKQKCVVIAPSLIPKRPGDRVKTDRRDAENLARLYRAGELTEVRVPERKEEAARDLVRVREDALEDRLRARHRMSKFLLRQGQVYEGKTSWCPKHLIWLRSQRFEWPHLQQTFEANLRACEEAEGRLECLNQQVRDLAQGKEHAVIVRYLRCLKGIDTLSAVTLAVEAQDFRRFKKAREFMSYSGLVCSEFSSGQMVKRGSITKTGNAHIRRILGEAAWSYRRGNVVNRELLERREGCPREVVAIARAGQDRLCRKFARLTHKGKLVQKAVIAVARELGGFVWAIGQEAAKAPA